MTHPSKRKGNNFEREVVEHLRDAGLHATRVPLSGAVQGYPGDIVTTVQGDPWTLECKIRAQGFTTFYNWLPPTIKAVVFRDNRSEPLVTMRLCDFIKLARLTNGPIS